MKIELLRVSGNELDIINAARVSHLSESESFEERDKKLLNYLFSHEHHTPFEHTLLSFRCHVPIFVARQWMRHRMGSFNELSGRYKVMPDEFYIPDEFFEQSTDNKQGSSDSALINTEYFTERFEQVLNFTSEVYSEFLALGMAKEQARMILPLCVYTEFIWTVNLRSLLNFLKLRLDEHAQAEIRECAYTVLSLAKPHFPNILSLAFPNIDYV